MKELLDVAETIPGWMNREELEWLGNRAALSSRVAEIGVHEGRSTWMLAALCTKVHCVDKWDDTDVFVSFLKRYDREITKGVVVPFRGRSVAAAQSIGGKFDLVFIDADHSYQSVRFDIRAWAPKVAAGGMMAGHDYDPFWPGVQHAVNEAFPLRFQRGPGSIWFVVL